ncbi:RNA polymerase sigma factor (sigma-70 family) [Paenibacillus anaericanus]|uniref:RNA polymerase sigma factor n=1 Tax=Paenibacillus anaericanus TaxID=170367 RepID=UPI002788CC99|nr:sigma-70 family RNA polymerase sigma factor [Paenibacillus anaericanus]MDQ0088686.1 RNA polymerase sigma factor (sigma-70 family) [Paenibacillus anaericanus]
MNQDSVDVNSLTDDMLVLQARDGQSQAFNELMTRHRKKALHIATKITNDPHLAEDVVQEALMNAFLHLGSLEHIERFVPWFQRIISNQALMHVRRGGPFAKEKPFSAYTMSSDQDNHNQGDDFPIDLILNTLARNANLLRHEDEDPIDTAIRLETNDMLRSLLHCLNPKEREMFEAHFFKQYSPQEIAAMCSTSSSNVYTTLSRSRRKIQQTQFQSNLTRYLHTRSNHPFSINNELQDHGIYIGEIWDTYSLCVMHALQYSTHHQDSQFSMAEIMGLTGQAFRIQIHRNQLDLAGVTTYNWRNTFSKGLLNLGYAPRSLGEGLRIPQTNELLIDAFSFVHESIDQGNPVIVWGIQQPFFSLIHGYDDRQRSFRIKGFFQQKTIDYEQFGREWSADLFVLTLGTAYEIKPIDSLRGALSMIITHAEGAERSIHPEYIQGILAYDVWISALSQGHIDHLANAYNVWFISNARSFAVEFLNTIAEHHDDNVYGSLGLELSTLATQASSHYVVALQALYELRKLFPFPNGGNPHLTNNRDAGIKLLKQVKMSEQQGLNTLKSMLQILCR